MSSGRLLSTDSYWDDYYRQSPHQHVDWYLPNHVVLHHVHSELQQQQRQHQLKLKRGTAACASKPTDAPVSPAVRPPRPLSPPPLRVLQIGCGSSAITESLVSLGYSDISNIDFSSAVIHSLQRAAASPSSRLPASISFSVMDARRLQFPDASFDLVLDKGTLDCVALSGERGSRGASGLLDEACRVLTAGGAFLCFSLFGYDDRMRMMEERDREPGEDEDGSSCRADADAGADTDGDDERVLRDWRVQYHVLGGPLELPAQLHTFLYVCHKGDAG